MGRLAGRGQRERIGKPRPAKVPVQRQAWRSWYSLAEWRSLKKAVIARDGSVCQQTGEALVGKYPAPNSPTVDHIIPHRGNRTLFFDPGNLQLVSKRWHDTVKQSKEKRGLVQPDQ